jgi:hypothetical protein
MAGEKSSSSSSKQTPSSSGTSKGKEPVVVTKETTAMAVDDDDDSDEEDKQFREDMVRENRELRSQLEYLNGEMVKMGQLMQAHNDQRAKELKDQQRSLQSIATGKDIGEIIKPTPPKPFTGKTEELQVFLTQLKAYFAYFPSQFSSDDLKTRYAAGRLEGTAAHWFEPALRAYVDNNQDEPMIEAFVSYDNFERLIRQTYGTYDDEREAENKLSQLRQTGSATEYSTKYLQITSRLPWGQAALMAYYYDGLKEEVKDELFKEDRPMYLHEYIEMAVKIDNRQYERRRQKQQKKKYIGYTDKYKPNQPRARMTTAHGTHAGAMELDALQKDKKDIECYNCGKKGHYKRECRSKPKSTNKKWKPVPEKQINTIGRSGYDVTGEKQKFEQEHNDLPWTDCWKGDCERHREKKELSGWFPIKPKALRAMRIVRTPDTLPELIPMEEPGELPANEYGYREQPDPDPSDMNLVETMPYERYRLLPDGPDSLLVICATHGNTPQPFLEQLPTYADQRLWPGDGRHPEISWISCYWGTCPVHHGQKRTNKLWPLVNPKHERILKEPYLNREMQHFTRYRYFRNLSVVMFRLKPNQPPECLLGRPLTRCPEPQCPAHLNAKIAMWHKYCGREDPCKYLPLHCTDSRCPTHAQEQSIMLRNIQVLRKGKYVVSEYCQEYEENEQQNARWRELQERVEDIFFSHKCDDCREDLDRDEIRRQLRIARDKGLNLITLQGQNHIKNRYEYLTDNWLKCHCYESDDNIKQPERLEDPYDIIEGGQALIELSQPRTIGAMQADSGLQLVLDVQIGDHKLRALVDSGAMADYISPTVVNRHQLPWARKKQPYVLHNIEGERLGYENGMVTRETDHLIMDLPGKSIISQFDITEVKDYDLVLGFPWLRKNNPQIDWRTGQLSW